MKFGDIFNLSLRMFKARTSRTILTILGMSIGISAILFMVSFGYGLQKTLLEKIITSDSLLTLDITESGGEAVLNNDYISQISEIPEVSEVVPVIQLKAQGSLDKMSTDLNAVVADPLFFKLAGFNFIYGEGFGDENSDSLVIASGVAKVFGKENVEEMIGKEINLSVLEKNYELKYSGKQSQPILKQNLKIIGIVESDENVIYLKPSYFQGLVVEKYDQLKVKCESQVAMISIRNSIINLGFSVSSISDSIEQANKVFRFIQLILMLFGFIALAVSAIGMFNTMTIALLERTEEIGIMKSIGASNLSISGMFLTESTIMGFLGGLGGIIIGLLAGEVCNQIINFIAVRLGGYPVRLFESPWWFILIIAIFGAIVGLLTGIAPARRASKIDPLEALRYK